MGNVKKHIVKRQGHTEAYDQRKLYASVYASLVSLRTAAPEAELVADRVCKHVEEWLDKKHEVTSKDILRNAAHHLQNYNDDAAFLYLHHRSVS